MKIIGITETGYILDATRDEVMNVMGFYSVHAGGTRAEAAKLKLKLDMEIPISEMYRQLQELSSMQATLKENATVLRRAATLIEKIPMPAVLMPARD